MKKTFQGTLIIFLTYTFLCCPVFAKTSFADNHGIPPVWVQRYRSVLSFISENLSDWIQDYTPPRTPSDIQANREKRNEIREGIRNAWNNPPFRC